MGNISVKTSKRSQSKRGQSKRGQSKRGQSKRRRHKRSKKGGLGSSPLNPNSMPEQETSTSSGTKKKDKSEKEYPLYKYALLNATKKNGKSKPQVRRKFTVGPLVPFVPPTKK